MNAVGSDDEVDDEGARESSWKVWIREIGMMW